MFVQTTRHQMAQLREYSAHLIRALLKQSPIQELFPIPIPKKEVYYMASYLL